MRKASVYDMLIPQVSFINAYNKFIATVAAADNYRQLGPSTRHLQHKGNFVKT